MPRRSSSDSIQTRYQASGRTRCAIPANLEVALTTYCLDAPKWRLKWARYVLMDQLDYPGILPPSLVTAALDTLRQLASDDALLLATGHGAPDAEAPGALQSA